MHINPQPFAVGAILLAALGLSGCSLLQPWQEAYNDHATLDSGDVQDAIFGSQPSGHLIDVRSGKVVEVLSRGLEHPLQAWESFYPFYDTDGSISQEFRIDGVLNLNGTTPIDVVFEASLTPEQVASYFNKMIDAGYDFARDSTNHTIIKAVSYDIGDTFEMAAYDGIMPVASLVSNGVMTTRQNLRAAELYAAGFTAEEAWKALYAEGCTDSLNSSGNGVDCAQHMPGDATVVFDYNFKCTMTEVAVNNWPGVSSGLNALLKTDNLDFRPHIQGSVTVVTSQPCGIITSFEYEDEDARAAAEANADPDVNPFYDGDNITTYNDGEQTGGDPSGND